VASVATSAVSDTRSTPRRLPSTRPISPRIVTDRLSAAADIP
jgi:hypothetical protein